MVIQITKDGIVRFFFRIRWMRRVLKDASFCRFKEFYMKRKFIALFAVLLVLMLATCSSDESVTEEGMVTLSINVVNAGGASRALTAGLGAAAADTYEVVFVSGLTPTYYQAAWTGSTGNSITIPTGTYADETKAILFAGKSNANGERTLLGVGTLTGTTPSTSTTINSTTTAVTFTVNSLVNAVSTTAASSTFQITGPDEDDIDELNYVTGDLTDFTPAIPTTTATPNYPVFRVPAKGYPAPSSATKKISATYKINTIPYPTVVRVKTAAWSVGGTADPISVGSETGITGVTFSPTSPTLTAGAAITSPLTLAFDIDVSNASGNGLFGLLIDVEVCAYTNAGGIKKASNSYTGGASDYTETWTIRGGSDLTTADGLATPGNGAAVLLAVGTHGKFVNVTVNPATPWQ